MSRWNFGTTAAGAELITRHKLELKRGGHAWRGHWEEQDGKLYVCSAYGSRTDVVGRDPAAQALKLFGEILDERAGKWPTLARR